MAGKVDVAILGAPLNMGSGWRDSGERATVALRQGIPAGSWAQTTSTCRSMLPRY